MKPQYKDYGYDRNFDHSGDPREGTVPEIKPVEPIVQVYRIGDVFYDTFIDAINAVYNQETVLLCKSFVSSNINIGKSITIIPDESVTEPIIITKKAAGNLIGISTSSIHIGNKSLAEIILYGRSF